MPSKPRSLHLHEEVLLLALRDVKGTVRADVIFELAGGGAILAELILQKRLGTSTEGRSTYAVVESERRLGDPILDEALGRVTDAVRRAKLQTWVRRFGSIKQLKHRTAAELVRKGILREDEDRVLLLFSRRTYPARDSDPERRIIARLTDAVFSDATLDPRTTVLVALAHHSGLLKANLDKKQLRSRKARIEAIVKGEVVGKATKAAIEAMQAAIVVAAIVPGTAVTTT